MAEDSEQVRPRRSRRRRAAYTLLAVIAILAAGLWLARKPIASRYADRFLADKHVAARYRIADLGLGRQRLENVVIGDPRDPDLVADWLEARTAIGLSGPYLTGVRGGHVRVRARWVGGRLSLGSIDRLLPRGEPGKPFALPALSLGMEDLRARVETPWGVVGARLSGGGRLDGGFDGRLALVSTTLGQACRATAPRAALRVQTVAGLLARAASVRVSGSAEAQGLACAGATASFANVNGNGEVTPGEPLRWTGRADIAGAGLRHDLGMAKSFAGSIDLAGNAQRTAGRVALHADGWAGSGASGARLAVAAPFVIDPDGLRAGDEGRATLAANGVRIDPRLLGSLTSLGRSAPGTPIAPLLAQFAQAARRAAAGFDATATGALVSGGGTGSVRLSSVELHSPSGATARWTGSAVRGWGGEEGDTLDLDGTLAAGGGGLPTLTARLAQANGAELRGTATVAPYTAGSARLALTPVAFARGPAGWRLSTRATLSGPLGDGRVEGLTLPLDVRGRGANVTLTGICIPVAWQRLAVSVLILDPARLDLCGDGGALVTVTNGRLAGGATLAAARLTGRLGTTPLTLAAARTRVQLAGQRFALADVAAQLGTLQRLTTLTAASLDGTLAGGGVTGSFAGAGGQIGAVPLAMSDAAGAWRFAAGTLTVTGGLTVADARKEAPRFKPLPVRDIALTLRGNAIEATGNLRSPDATRPVAAIRVAHDLRTGTGTAGFTVPGLVFDKGLQPDQLTPVTFGIIAEVRGTVTGEGRIDWKSAGTGAGVTSSGSFTTEGTDLAAAVGPVHGIAGTIRFTDLLALESAPGQTFHVREVNPGIAVTDGTVTFQTLPDARVRVEGARWPFAGGSLTLEPTLLDFAEHAERRLTFHVAGAAADQFLQQFDFPNLDATGIFDGVLPMVFDASGGRIENGHLTVREGGGTIAYVGAISQKDVGFWGNLAFQALKSLRYRSLAIQMNGPLAGEMVTEVRFAGVSQGEGAAKGGIAGLLVGRLQRLPFIFNIRIRAPFRGLLDATASFYDPRRLIQRNLPQLIEEQNRRARQAPPSTQNPSRPIQPPASETVP